MKAKVIDQIQWQYCSLDICSNEKAELNLCEMEEAISVVDWLVCPRCKNVTKVMLSFDYDKNFFEEMERIIKESETLRCEHCGQVFHTDADGNIFLANDESENTDSGSDK